VARDLFTPDPVVGNGTWLYEAKRMRFGRGFDSRQLHHIHPQKIPTNLEGAHDWRVAGTGGQ